MTTTHSNEFNVLVFSYNIAIIKTLKKVCQGMRLPLIEAEKETDVIAYDYRIAFIDKKLFSDTLIEGLRELSEFEKSGDWEIVVLGESPSQFPIPLDVFCRSLSEYTLDEFATILHKHLSKVRRVPEQLIKSRMHRLVSLKSDFENSFVLDRKELCEKYGITERTFFRDVKLIREVFPDIIVPILGR
jgi:hypothetical protein